MAGRRLRNQSITFVEDSIDGRDSNEVDEVSSLDNTAVNQEAETEGTVTSECEGNNSDSIVATHVSVGMSIRQLQDLLTNTISTLRADIVTIIETNNSKFQVECSNLLSDILTIIENLDSKLQAATENITAKIQQENEKLSEKLTQKLHSEVKKLSSDINTLRNDTEHKFQEVTRTTAGISDALNERMW
jgi:ribosome-associated translation inhibitor RaiA